MLCVCPVCFLSYMSTCAFYNDTVLMKLIYTSSVYHVHYDKKYSCVVCGAQRVHYVCTNLCPLDSFLLLYLYLSLIYLLLSLLIFFFDFKFLFMTKISTIQRTFSLNV